MAGIEMQMWRIILGTQRGRRGWDESREWYWRMYAIASGSCCVTQGTQPRALWGPRSVGMGRTRKLRRESICVYLWLIHIVVWQKLTQHCKAIILQLKKKKHCQISNAVRAVTRQKKLKKIRKGFMGEMTQAVFGRMARYREMLWSSLGIPETSRDR